VNGKQKIANQSQMTISKESITIEKNTFLKYWKWKTTLKWHLKIANWSKMTLKITKNQFA